MNTLKATQKIMKNKELQFVSKNTHDDDIIMKYKNGEIKVESSSDIKILSLSEYMLNLNNWKKCTYKNTYFPSF